MPRTLIVGFGRAGHGLHWSVLRRLRGMERCAGLFSSEPPVVYDCDPHTAQLTDPTVIAVPDLERAREILDPDDTIVHLCTPPTHRLGPLTELAGLGFKRILVEKPLVATVAELPAIDELRRSHDLKLMVVAHWLQSALTRRLRTLVQGGELGTLQSVFIAQRKPRIARTLATQGHPTAFDVELPHSVGVVLSLAGDAVTAGAELHDMRVKNTVVPEMGAARLLLDHHGGVRTEIFSDLASPIRERVIQLGFSRGWAVGHYPVSENDDYAHLDTSVDGLVPEPVFRDDSLARFLVHAYEEFTSDADLEPDFLLNARVTTVLAEAKERARLARLDAEIEADVRPQAVPHAL
ncbi:Gfo/Idh/MocA family oxidoreductase [Streptomyces beihaiensis]|uniref:Gfo/Idh/MocA family oxidoreductase n=1 Tax=Streptomyces beihaiensis TaxID=2984495 RepID=A0ABT3TRS3_9ACTN|nr:Gfo/Idh/MocA family oxidoreductase [Streptomyces beihaiensis]MCX3059475.1 Gfo/Idh/MocA family oxidoreductase [Streptomyces beihaiensis]